MKNGFILPVFDLLVRVLFRLNIVEYFKYFAQFIVRVFFKFRKEKETVASIVSASNIAIDIYQIFKYAVLAFLWINASSSVYSRWVIYYLIASNLFTYFYYHVWGSRYRQRNDRSTLNRKFLNFLLAIAFYLLCYAYLYQFHYSAMISWPDSTVDGLTSFYLSVANAFTLTYGGFMPLTQEIRLVFLSELFNTFLFFTVIISNSVPDHSDKE